MPIKPTKNNDGNRRRERGDQTRVNERIRAPRVRVVTANGDQLGIMNTREALEKAKALGLDLVEVASNADPPVCRVVDYGRYKYQQSKLQKTNKSRTIKLKEVKLRIGTDTNDYNVKMARTESFLRQSKVENQRKSPSFRHFSGCCHKSNTSEIGCKNTKR